MEPINATEVPSTAGGPGVMKVIPSAAGGPGLSFAGGAVATNAGMLAAGTGVVTGAVCAGSGVLDSGVAAFTGALNAVCAKLHRFQPLVPCVNDPLVTAETVTFIVPVLLCGSANDMVVTPPASPTTYTVALPPELVVTVVLAAAPLPLVVETSATFSFALVTVIKVEGSAEIFTAA
jgi:hypothetical protein